MTQSQGWGVSPEQASAHRGLIRQVWDLPALLMEDTQHECEVKFCPYCHCFHQWSFLPTLLALYNMNQESKRCLSIWRNINSFLAAGQQSWSKMSLVIGSVKGRWWRSTERLTDVLPAFVPFFMWYCWFLLFFTAMKRASDWRENGTSFMLQATIRRRGMPAVQNWASKQWRILVFPTCYRGTVMPDTRKLHFRYSQAQHAWCNAHLLRELQALWEVYEQWWAKDLMDFSLEMKQEVEQAGRCLSSERNRQYERMYERLLYQQGKGHDEARKLHRWLQEYLAEVLRFPHDPDVPFDNN